MTLRLLHTADWQLGKPFTRFGGDDLGALLREARFAAVRRLAELATAEKVTAVLVAGDILESEHAEPALLRRMVARMAGFAGPWLLLPGNHDPARPGGVWDRFLASGDCPANIHVLKEPVPLPLAEGRLVVLPAPLRQTHVAGDPSEWFATASLPSGVTRVGLAHGAVRDFLPAAAHGPNPIASDRAERAGLDYLALGDWHSALRVGPRAWYSGTPEPDDFTKSGIGEALLVTLPGQGLPPLVERRRTGQHQWREARLALGHGADAAAIEDQLAALLADIAAPGETILRLALDGTLDLQGHAALEAAIERRRAGLRHLEAVTDGLSSAPSEADLAALARDPAIAQAAAALRGSADPAAALALRLLHAEWQRLEQG